MRPLQDWPAAERREIVGVFTDIDDTLSTDGQVPPSTVAALGDLKSAGLHVIPITGRPVGWCEPFAAAWPVDAIVAENGAVALVSNKKNACIGIADEQTLLSKIYQQDATTRRHNQVRMQQIAERVMREMPSARLAQDKGGRETDLAFDYHEFHQMTPEAVDQLLALLRSEGMHTTVSSIHVHGCYGDFNKWSGACWAARELLQRHLPQELERWVFVGDSGNDQPMFQHFVHSVGVANIRRFASQLTYLPGYITPSERGRGFEEVAQALLAARSI